MFDTNIFTIIAVLFSTLAILYIIWQYRLSMYRFNDTFLSKMRSYPFSQSLFMIRIVMISLAFVCIALAILKPQWGIGKTTSQSNGIDMVFVLDVSKSMDALDAGSTGARMSRIDFSKEMISSYVVNNPHNRYGLVIFAGESFVTTPLTIDSAAFLTFLEGTTSDSIANQGSDLLEGIKASISRFKTKEEQQRGKAVVLISDGGEDELNDLNTVADILKKEQIAVFTVGVGGTKPTPIPEIRGMFGHTTYKTHRGQTVMTKLYDKPLKDIASATGGRYMYAQSTQSLDQITGGLSSLTSTSLIQQTGVRLENRYQIFLLSAFILWLGFVFIPSSKEKMNMIIQGIFPKSKKNARQISVSMLTIAFLPLSIQIPFLSDFMFKFHNQRGNEYYKEQYLEDAKEAYKKASDKQSGYEHIAQNNMGLIEYEKQRYPEAERHFRNALDTGCKDQTLPECDKINYNLGNTLYRKGERQEDAQTKKSTWMEAIQQYEESLRINPSNKQAQENIDFIKRKLEEQEEESSGDNSQNSSETNEQSEQSDNKEQESNSSQNDQNQNNNNTFQQSPERTNQRRRPGLSDEEKRRLDAYRQQLEREEKNLSEHFKQNPSSQKGNNNSTGSVFDSFFNDPFFNDFFGNPGRNTLPEKDNQNKKDW